VGDDVIFPILDAGTPEGAERLARLSGRVAALEELASSAAREKTVAAFGEPLAARAVVSRMVAAVRERGDEAVAEFSEKLDGAKLTPPEFRVPAAELKKALAGAPSAFVEAAERAAGNIREFQKRLVPAQAELAAPEANDGLRLGARWTPVERAACYVPGGIASYPSSVLMNAIPAQVAGVDRLVLAMPPGKEGAGNPLTLAAAALIGCEEVYRVGGVQAVAALAFGTETIPKVDVIVGPGNLFVMLAKREVFGSVNIDMFAGPSEILVITDGTTNPDFAAADLLSQAEHDPMASAILVTSSREVAEAVRTALVAQLEKTPRREVAEESLKSYGLALVVKDIDAAARVASDIAPEHLEILAANAEELAAKIRNAGAIFLGPWAPECLGDYAAGPSHTLPTGGTARFMSGLSPMSFMKRTSLIEATEEGLKRELRVIDGLARADRLPAHGSSARRRADG
jgi:histidinol dehydrogenase